MSYVYFIAADEFARVKIGVSSNPYARLSKIASDTACSVRLIGIEEGGYEREAELHRLFASDLIIGEWYRHSPDIAAHIANLPEWPISAKQRKFGPTALSLATGWSQSYCSMMLKGDRPITLDRAMFIHERTGLQMGPIKDAEEELGVLRKYVEPWTAPRDRPQQDAA